MNNMKKLILLLSGVLGFTTAEAAMPADSSSLWVTAYYAGWSQGWFNNGVLPADSIDYSAVTHIIHFSLDATADGTLLPDDNSIRPENSSSLIAHAHAAGKKVLICVGGWGSASWFRSATGSLIRPVFIANLLSFMTTRGYDGIDIDWEILEQSDAGQFQAFIKDLRGTLDRITPRPLLTVAAASSPGVIAPIQEYLDQVNIMTYDLSGAWPGWVTWHNAPLSNGGFVFPSTGRPVPSADQMIKDFNAAGIPSQKLGIGIDFYGYVWIGGDGTSTGGVTKPRQTWTAYPVVRPNIPYSTIMQTYYQPQRDQWDSAAGAAYISVDNLGSQNDVFVSYDNEESCRKKVQYAKKHGLGGVIIWELGGGYLPASFPQRDRLLQAVKRAAIDTAAFPVGIPAIPSLNQPANNSVGISTTPTLVWFRSSGSFGYHLQVSSDTDFKTLLLDDSSLSATIDTIHSLAPATTYYWRVAAQNSAGSSPFSESWRFTTARRVTQLPETPPFPRTYVLNQNFPNPFNSTTHIGFDLPQASIVRIEVFSLLGKRIETVTSEALSAGHHDVSWEPNRLPTGMYVYRLTAIALEFAEGHDHRTVFVDSKKLLYIR